MPANTAEPPPPTKKSSPRTVEEFADLPPSQKGSEDRTLAIDRSLQAEASSAHSRINIPLNLNNWKDQPQDVQQELMWLHQWILDNDVSWTDAEEALGRDKSTIFRILKGTYQAADWMPIADSIASFRKLQVRRADIQRNEFRPNAISRLISAGLDYALANNSIATIEGESRMGKTASIEDWKMRNNHGRSVLVEVPPIGGPKGLLLEIAKAVGVNRNTATPQLLDSVRRAFNRNRILIIDEAHRTLPTDRRSMPVSLEVVRHIHDKTHAAVALISTQRITERMKGSTYQFEQVLGRIGMPIVLPTALDWEDIEPIVTQFLPELSAPLADTLRSIANEPGRLGILVETLKVASRIARKSSSAMAEQHVRDAISMRKQMMNPRRGGASK